jgi:hypothetical protein
MEGSRTQDDVATRSLIYRLGLLRAGLRLLAFGIGSSPHQLIALVPHASEIHVAEPSVACLELFKRWQASGATADAWSLCTRRVLALEGVTLPSHRRITQRNCLTRDQLTHCMLANLRLADPLGHALRSGYDCIVACLASTAEPATLAQQTGELRNLASLLKRDGTLLVQTQRGQPYAVGYARGRLLPLSTVQLIYRSENSVRQSSGHIDEVA